MPKPITDATIDKHKHILMYDDETVLDAVQHLRDEGGQDWWHLVLDREDGSYAVGRFSDLSQYVSTSGETALKKFLGDLIGEIFKTVDVTVEQSSSDLNMIREQTSETESKVAVVTAGGNFRGIVPVGGTRSGGVFDSSLVELAGKFAEIPKKGVLSRRRRDARNRKTDTKKKKNDI